MPDFVFKRKADRKLLVRLARRDPVALSSISIPKSKQSKQGPLSVLSKLSKNFLNGISALQKITYEKLKGGKQHPQKIVHSEHRIFTTRERIRDYDRTAMSVPAEKKDFLTKSQLSSPQAATPHPILVDGSVRFLVDPIQDSSEIKPVPGARAPSIPRPLGNDHKNERPVTPPTISRSYRALKHPIRRQRGIPRVGKGKADNIFSFGKQGLVTSADREAAQSVREQYVGEFHQLPAAARVAQVMRADELIRNGEGKEHPVLRALAQAAREGRKRFVADVNPSYLQRAFSEAFGGSTKAEQVLSTPVIHDMAEKYRFAVESIQCRVEAVRNGVGPERAPTRVGRVRMPKGLATHSALKTSSGRGRGIEDNQPVAPPRLISSSASSSNYTPNVNERTHVHELRAQLAHNDFGHLPSAGENAVNEEKLNTNGPSTNRRMRRSLEGDSKSRQESAYDKSGDKVGESKSVDRRISSEPAMISTRSGPMPAPPSQIARAPSSSAQSKEGTKPANNRFTGELRMIDATGRSLGRAELEMKGG